MKQFINRVFYATFCVVALLFAQAAMAQKVRTITGQVFDNAGQPMIGASVVVVGNTSVGTTTDLEGKFKIRASETDNLSFSFLGYKEVTERVGSRTTINIILQPDNVSINEVVVIGYGQQAKSDLTGAVASVNMEDLASASMSSVDEALQGRMAGVEIVTTDGEPGSAASIRVRGSRSITASNEPLIVVDGVMDAVENFSDLNPSDIKSVTVLKDASSTAIYGTRGANGVILVTTNESKGTKLNVQFKATFGMAELARTIDVMNAAEFAQWRNDYLDYSSYLSKGTAGRSSISRPYHNPASYGEGTNWLDVMTRKAFNQNYWMAISGGGKNTSIYFSMSYNNTQGIIISSGSQNLSGRLKVDHQAFKWLKLGINANYSIRNQDKAHTSVSGNSASAVVLLNPLRKPLDTWNSLDHNGGQVYDSPLYQAMLKTNETRRNILTLSPYLEFTLTKGLKLKSRFSYTHTTNNSFYHSPSTLPVAEHRKIGGTATRSDSKTVNLLSETTLSYNRTFKKKHKVDAVVGFTAQNRTNEYMYIKAVGLLDDNVTYHNMHSAVDRRNVTTSTSATELQRYSVLARANYTYDKRYHFTLTGRYDGSSIFATGSKWAFFPAAAFKWSISQEKFMRSAKHWLTDLSVRLSAGTSGNDAVSTYVSQMVLTNTEGGWLFGNSQDVAYYPTRLDNPNLTWEKTTSFNIGIDFAVLDNRLAFSLEAYKSYTSDLLLTVENATVTGYSSRYANIGSTENIGAELTITSRNITKKNFQWTTNLTVAHNSSLVTDIGTEYDYVATLSYEGYMAYGYKPGYPANSIWGFKYAGVWHNQEEINRNKSTHSYISWYTRLGAPRYIDVNHDGRFSNDDLVYLGSADPILHGGLNNTFRIFKNLTVGVYFTYGIGGHIVNVTEKTLGNGHGTTNKYRYMLDGWHPIRNPNSDIVSPYNYDYYNSDRFTYDASYIRLQNINLGYTFDLRKKTRFLRDITLTASINNVCLFTNYRGYDPDAMSSGRRLDTGKYPKNRNYTFAIRIRY